MTITHTKLKDIGKPIRTILLKSKKGYQGFFTNFIRLKAKQTIKLYQSHWAQENSYRILKNDLPACASTADRGLDYLPKRKKRNPKKDRLNTTAIGFVTPVCVRRTGRYPDRLLITLDPFRDQEVLRPYVTTINKECLTIPWLRNLQLMIGISPGKYAHKKGNYL